MSERVFKTLPWDGSSPAVYFYDVTDPTKAQVFGPAPGVIWTNVRAQCNLATGAGVGTRRAFIYVPMWIFSSNPTGDGPQLARTGEQTANNGGNCNGTGNATNYGTGPADATLHCIIQPGFRIGPSEHVFITYDPGSPWLTGDNPTGALIVEEIYDEHDLP
jgi:hypothetical protein